MLARIFIVIGIGLFVLFDAAIVAVMHDKADEKLLTAKEKQHLFHRWLIIWAAIHTVVLVVIWYIATGTLLGVEL